MKKDTVYAHLLQKIKLHIIAQTKNKDEILAYLESCISGIRKEIKTYDG